MAISQIVDEHTAKFVTLKSLIAKARGFTFIPVAFNQVDYRDYLIKHLAADSQCVNAKAYDSIESLEQALATQDGICHLINIESHSTEFKQAIFYQLNLHRESIASGIKQALLIWLPEYLLKQLALQAPDFWAWREQSFDFTQAAPLADRAGVNWGVRDFSYEDKSERIQALSEYIDSHQEESLLTADSLHELGLLHYHTGEYAQARAYYQRAADMYLALGDAKNRASALQDVAQVLIDQGNLDEAWQLLNKKILPKLALIDDLNLVAITQGKIADILNARGELDEALRIRREKQLPVYENLDDIRAIAITQGKIADILYARGELDEGLRIRQEEELPVYEKLGDIRGIAFTQGKIADIFYARGELDEALRIRQEEELPVYEKLGDIQSIAVTQGKIADILYARGELDEALRIWQDEQLPVYKRLGDIRSIAITQGRIVSILYARGELDEALRIGREEELPIYEKLNSKRELLVCKTNIALLLYLIDFVMHKAEINHLLAEAELAAEEMVIPEADKIRAIRRSIFGES